MEYNSNSTLDGSPEMRRAQEAIRGFSAEANNAAADRVRVVRLGASYVRSSVHETVQRVEAIRAAEKDREERAKLNADLIAAMPDVVAPVELDNSPVDPANRLDEVRAIVDRAYQNPTLTP